MLMLMLVLVLMPMQIQMRTIHAPHGRFRHLAMIGTCPSTPVTLSCSMVARRPKRAIRCGNAAVSCDEVRRRHSHMEWW
jgi:hypothetical protein